LRASESRDAVLTVGVCSFEQGFDTKGTGYALTHSLNQWLHKYADMWSQVFGHEDKFSLGLVQTDWNTKARQLNDQNYQVNQCSFIIITITAFWGSTNIVLNLRLSN